MKNSPIGSLSRRPRAVTVGLSMPTDDLPATSDLLRTSDVAAMFQVSTRTVSEWARRGRLPCMRTPGGQWRYPADAVGQLVRLAERGVWDADAPLGQSNGTQPGYRRTG